MRLKLFLSVLFFCGITKAQTNLELKEFINKNRSVLKNIQKNMIVENNTNYIIPFKELVKSQTASVNLYNINNLEASFNFAFQIRLECLNFLKNHSESTPEIYKMTDLEKTWVKSDTNSNKPTLSETELKTIDSQNFLDSQSLNNLTLTIQ